MKTSLIRSAWLALLLAITGIILAQPIEPWVANNQDIHDYLLNLQTRFPANIHLDSVGHSQQLNMPIWMARISSNATIEQDKPRILLIGQVHAEEYLGVMLSLRLAAELCSLQSNTAPARYRDWRNQLEIYIMPTANPEGLQVVTSNDDPYFRKNQRQLMGNSLHYFPGVGNDSDGVDINRNFPINWEFGDTIWQVGAHPNELFDYYRGPAAASEAETQALMAINLRLRPMFGIVYHSSQTGSLSQKIYYPWDWEATGTDVVTPGRHSPDYGVISEVCNDVGANMQKHTHDGFYQASGYRTRNGALQDWFYQSTGCIMMECEIGPAVRNANHPDSITAIGQMNDVIAGNYVLFNRALNTNPTGSSLTGLVTDSISHSPIEGVEVRLVELYDPILAPRLTNSVGRYNRPVSQGSYNLEFRKYGYATRRISNVIVGSNQRRPVSTTLVALPTYNVTFQVVNPNSAGLGASVIISHPDRPDDTLQTNRSGLATTRLVADTFRVIVNNEYYVVQIRSIVPSFEGETFQFRLVPYVMNYTDGFEQGTDFWTFDTNANWGTDGQSHTDLYALADSPDGTPFYPRPEDMYHANTNTTALCLTTIPLGSGATDASLSYWIKGFLEPAHDSCWAEASIDNGVNWSVCPGTTISMLRFDWRRVNISLRQFLGHQVRFRIRMMTDDKINQDGIHLDDIDLRIGNTTSVDLTPQIPGEYRLATPYPNPFNATLRIPYIVPKAGEVSFRIYDLTGRTVATFNTHPRTAGATYYLWNASSALHGEPASGIYFIEMKAGSYHAVKKAMLLK